MIKQSFSLETNPDLQPERKWCPICNDWYTPRPCNAKKQKYCCKTKACEQASKNASNRKYRLKMSQDATWRHDNVFRVQRLRRILRYGFDAEAVTESLDRFFDNLAELLRFVAEALSLLKSLIALLLPAVILQKLSRHPATVEMHLEMAQDRIVASSKKAICMLKTIPALTLRDCEMARCA